MTYLSGLTTRGPAGRVPLRVGLLAVHHQLRKEGIDRPFPDHEYRTTKSLSAAFSCSSSGAPSRVTLTALLGGQVDNYSIHPAHPYIEWFRCVQFFINVRVVMSLLGCQIQHRNALDGISSFELPNKIKFI